MTKGDSTPQRLSERLSSDEALDALASAIRMLEGGSEALDQACTVVEAFRSESGEDAEL